MQRWLVVCVALLASACADECPDGAACEDSHTCCSSSSSQEKSYGCCPFDQAECCEDHVHCCPEGTLCVVSESSCVNSTASVPWLERVSPKLPGHSKSFRMIRSYMGEEEDNICADQSRCPPEFSCLRTSTRFGCCPLAQGVACPDGKHCCPEGHQCSADCRSCIREDVVPAVMCSDGESECPEGTTCCETPDGSWGCCPMPRAVCCEDKSHCCPEGSTCKVEQSKCISSSTQKETPMWAKFPARRRAEWENQKEVTAQPVSGHQPSENAPDFTAAGTVPPFQEDVSVSAVTTGGNNVPCNETVSCEDEATCCKTKEGDWACCPIPQAVCCEDFIHCCPHDTKCNLAEETCDKVSGSVPWMEKVPANLREKEGATNVTCDPTHNCPDLTTCCKTPLGDWACCPLPEAVCCEDHAHCCPKGTTCDPTALTCVGPSGPLPMMDKLPAFNNAEVSTQTQPSASATITSTVTSTSQVALLTESSAAGGNKPGEGGRGGEVRVQCDPETTCPSHTTCCYMTSYKKWGCCPLEEAVCCKDGQHCCPAHYTCDLNQATCLKGEVAIPWYNKLPATAAADDNGVQAAPNACDAQTRCPEYATCCQLFTGQWGCCPLHKAVCCPDKEHCCPQGYSCNMDSATCQRLTLLQLRVVPLTRVYVSLTHLYHVQNRDVRCDDQTSCRDGETCCRTSSTTWGCCPAPNAVCCSDMEHCCPEGQRCGEGGSCIQAAGPRWDNWEMFFPKKKRALLI